MQTEEPDEKWTVRYKRQNDREEKKRKRKEEDERKKDQEDKDELSWWETKGRHKNISSSNRIGCCSAALKNATPNWYARVA